MESIIHDTTGLIHTVFASTSLVFGTLILWMQKGTTIHKRVGYAYVFSMGIMLITAFMIYRLFDGFGIFHFFAIVSTISLIGGMVPAIGRFPKNGWLDLHFSFMYWSVIGLYAAFISEIMTRIPNADMRMLGIAMLLVFVPGSIYFRKLMNKWGT